MTSYYNRDGSPAGSDVIAWARQFEASDRTVAKTRVGDAEVSTVFLGLNHQSRPDFPPLIFETMVFGGELDQELERYSTEEQARAGHALMVDRVRASR